MVAKGELSEDTVWGHIYTEKSSKRRKQVENI